MTLRRALLGPAIPLAREGRRRVVLLDVPLTPLDAEHAVEEVAAHLDAGRRGITVFTPDAHASCLALLSPERAQLYRRADFVLCDGAGLAWASRFLGRPVPRAPGVDVAWALCSQARDRAWSVYLLGGRPGVPERAAVRLVHDLPGIEVVGSHHGYFSGAGPVEELSRLAPDLLLVGLGCPKQEQWILAHRQLGAGVLMGVGGTLDIWAGLRRRAPSAVRRAGLEWAWRALAQPQRAGRLWAVPFLIYQACVCRLRLNLRAGRTAWRD